MPLSASAYARVTPTTGDTISKEPNSLSTAWWIGTICTMTALTLYHRGGLPPIGGWDYVGLPALGLLIFWMSRKRKHVGDLDPDLREQTRKGLAFRTGKALNGVLRGLRSRSAAT